MSESGQSAPKKKLKDEGLLLYAAAFGIVIIIWGAYFFWIRSLADIAKAGTFGDSFGALNTLFTGLAFGAVAISLKLQRDDLNLQREAMEDQREELARSAEALHKQVEAMTRSAVAQERAALAQESTAEMQAIAAEVATYSEALRATQLQLEAGSRMGETGWPQIKDTAIATKQKLIAKIQTLTGSLDTGGPSKK